MPRTKILVIEENYYMYAVQFPKNDLLPRKNAQAPNLLSRKTGLLIFNLALILTGEKSKLFLSEKIFCVGARAFMSVK